MKTNLDCPCSNPYDKLQKMIGLIEAKVPSISCWAPKKSATDAKNGA